jgi:hypothetical protein
MMWTFGGVMAHCVNAGGVVCVGNFLGGIEHLGVEFDISGDTHYGWIEIESRERGVLIIVHRWAYESEPGVPIFAGRIPEPSSLALVLACLGLALRRRRGGIGRR